MLLLTHKESSSIQCSEVNSFNILVAQSKCLTQSKCPLAVLKIAMYLLHIPKVNVLKVKYIPINKEQFHKELV